MRNSTLATLIMPAAVSYGRRKYPITRVTIHHAACVTTARALGLYFQLPNSHGSANYGIGNDGQIVLMVAEEKAACTSNSMENDHAAITIEVSNSTAGGDWPVSEAAMESLIQLLVDICQRNPGIGRLNFTGNLKGNMTMHKWFAATGCPGAYLGGKFPWIAEEVNRRLDAAEKAAQPPMEEAEMRYNTIEEIPDYAKPTVTRLVDAGALKGTGEGLDLSEDMIRMLVILDRMGKL